MTVLRQQALQMLEEVPDEQISYVIALLRDIRKNQNSIDEKLTKSRQAFQNLQKYRRKGNKDIDYKNEIADAIEEKYESIGWYKCCNGCTAGA